MGIRHILALIVLSAMPSSFGMGIDAQARSVKRSIVVQHFSSSIAQSTNFAISTESDYWQASNNLLELKLQLHKKLPAQMINRSLDPLPVALAHAAILINKTSVDSLMHSVANCHAVIDRVAPGDFYGNYVWPTMLYLLPASGLSAVVCGVFGEIRVAVGLSALAGISLIGVLAQAFRAPYYEAWKKNRPGEVKVAEAHEFGKHFLYALTALKEGRLEVAYQGTVAFVHEYERPAKL